MSRERTGAPPDSPPDDEEVGYGRPPPRHRIGSGEVRNPWGRRGKPRSAVDFLDETLVLRIDGEPRTLTRAEALDHFLFAKAARGDVRAIQLLQARSQARRQSAAAPGDTDLSPEQQASFDRFLRRAVAKLTEDGQP
jgi:hypothetical protein